MKIRKVESDLLNRISDGDTKALEELYDRYEQTVYSVLLQMCKNEEHCEKVIQQLFSTVWESRGKVLLNNKKLSPQILKLAKQLFIKERDTMNVY